ncbi:MAG: CoA transferase, partial [Trueperaceae bacterium]
MLDGVLVVDLSRILAGPYCTQLLADLGARVVKIEAPRGDDARAWGPPWAVDQSGYFLSVNRGKESVALDLKTERGRALARALVTKADVVVENFKVGDLERYGLDPASVASANPGLIYASITGYGATGPRAHDPGYDAALQAITGLMAMTGESGGGPVKLGVAWIDVLTGVHAAVGILVALRDRDRTGVGRHLQVSLFETALASLVNQAQGALLTGEAPQRMGSAHPSIVPYQAFETADHPLMLAVGNDAQFVRACEVLELPGLAADGALADNAGRVRHRSRLVPALQARFL